MANLTKEQKKGRRQKWQGQLKEVGRQLGKYLGRHEIYEGILKIVQSNEKIQDPPDICNWMFENYADSVASAIRRLNDDGKGTLSLKRLIQDIRDNRDVITREHFVSDYPEWLQKNGHADADFNSFADYNDNLISVKRLNKDIERLNKGTELIRHYTNKWVAHNVVNRQTTPIPTYKDVAEALTLIDGIFCKYNLLLTRSGSRTRKAERQDDWRQPLTFPWIETTQEED